VSAQQHQHGCVGLRDVQGAATQHAGPWFYTTPSSASVVPGDHSKDQTVQWYNGLNGWNLPWSEWTAADDRVRFRCGHDCDPEVDEVSVRSGWAGRR